MAGCVPSRVAVRMLLLFGMYAEGSIAGEWTYWKPPCKAQGWIVARPLKKGATHPLPRGARCWCSPAEHY